MSAVRPGRVHGQPEEVLQADGDDAGPAAGPLHLPAGGHPQDSCGQKATIESAWSGKAGARVKDCHLAILLASSAQWRRSGQGAFSSSQDTQRQKIIKIVCTKKKKKEYLGTWYNTVHTFKVLVTGAVVKDDFLGIPPPVEPPGAGLERSRLSPEPLLRQIRKKSPMMWLPLDELHEEDECGRGRDGGDDDGRAVPERSLAEQRHRHLGVH